MRSSEMISWINSSFYFVICSMQSSFDRISVFGVDFLWYWPKKSSQNSTPPIFCCDEWLKLRVSSALRESNILFLCSLALTCSIPNTEGIDSLDHWSWDLESGLTGEVTNSKKRFYNWEFAKNDKYLDVYSNAVGFSLTSWATASKNKVNKGSRISC